MNKILGPIISEKSMNDASKGRYTFKVAKDATKKEIKKEVEEKFKVNVLKTATISIKGRSLKAGKKRLEITLTPFKKAIVLLKQGQKISIFDSGAKE